MLVEIKMLCDDIRMLEFVLECGSVIWHGHISLKLDVWESWMYCH